MKSLSTYNHNALSARGFAPQNRGFTLIEVIVVLGILAVIASMGLAFSFDSYRGYLFRSEYTVVTHLLAKARNQAANNFNEAEHTLEITANDYRLYPNNGTYDPTDNSTYESFPRNQALSISSSVAPSTPYIFEFEQLSGNAPSCSPTACTITFGYGAKTQTITINEQGGITW